MAANVGTKSPDYHSRSMYYTGKNINATSGSRTANTTDLTVGDVLVCDPYGHDQGRFKDLANPTTGHLSNTAWVVTDVPPDAKRGGWIKAVPLAECANGIQAYTKANMTAGTTTLILVNNGTASTNERYLSASTTVNSALTATGIKAIAGETHDSSTTAAYKYVMPAY